MQITVPEPCLVALVGASFALTQVAHGGLPHFGGTQRLPRLVGAGPALKMLLTGSAIDGREAMRLGLATYLAESEAELGRVAHRV